jgi:tetratricopeptide (TPR) repeat protein
VSREFRSYRLKLANRLGALKGEPYEVKVQEHFEQGGFTLLDKLADYIRECDLVIHLVGGACGARPAQDHVRTMFAHLGGQPFESLPERSYTQWEYELAIRFDRPMFCYFATPAAPRDCGVAFDQSDVETQLQRAHLERIERSGKHYETFSGLTDLVQRVFYDLGLEAKLKTDNLPYKSLGSLFKGREEFLTRLHETLGTAEHRGHLGVAAIAASATAATVYGLGGIGKTRAALEYAHRYADEYTALLFMQADSPATLHQNLASLCGPTVLDLPEKDVKETEVQVAAVLEWMQRHPGWLLIMDSVDSEETAIALQSILARLSRSGQVVITSRLSNWEGAVETLALDVLSVEAATEFLLERTERVSNKKGGRRRQADDAARAQVLAVELGQLALALEQAGAYIVRYRSTFGSYMEEWEKRRNRVLHWFNERTMQYPRSVAVTWQTSFDRLSEPARRLLQLLGWLAADPIPESLLKAGGGPFTPVPAADSAYGETDASTPDTGDALAELADHSLVKRSDEKPMFSVHRLVQDVTRRNLEECEKLSCLKQALQWINSAFSGDPQDVAAWPVLGPLVPHVLAIVAFTDKQKVQDPTVQLMSQVGLLILQKAQFAEAEPVFRRALVIAKEAYEPDNLNVAECLNNLALLFLDTNRLKEAKPLLRRAERIYKKRLGPDSYKVGDVINNLALIMQEENRLQESDRLFRQALEIFEKSRGPNHPDIATALNNLAQLSIEMNRPEEAETLVRRALVIDESASGPEHPAVAIDLITLASLLLDSNRFKEAEPVIRRALQIDEASYGPEHPAVATDLSYLGRLLHAIYRLAEAEPCLQRALTIDEKSYGPEHPEIARDLNILASLLLETNRFAEAEPLFRRALQIDERAYGPEHPEITKALYGLGTLLQETDRFAEAESLFVRALQIDEGAYDDQHPEIAMDLGSLAWLLQQTNRHLEAGPLFLRSLQINERTFGATHSNVASSLNNLGLYWQELDQMAEAEQSFRRALEIDDNANGPEDPGVATSLNNLGWLLVETSRIEQGEPMFWRALEIFERSYGLVHSEIAVSLNNLGSVMLETNRMAEAESHVRRALAINERVFGIGHSEVAATLNILGDLQQRTDRLVEAEAHIRKSLAIREKAFGLVHPYVAASLNSLGFLLQKANRISDSEPLLRRALAIYESAYGPDHPKVAATLNVLGLTLGHSGRLIEAKTILRRACEIIARSLTANGHKPLGAQLIEKNYEAIVNDFGLSNEDGPVLP